MRAVLFRHLISALALTALCRSFPAEAAQIRFFTGAGMNAFKGEFDFEPGLAVTAGVIVPYSSALEFEGMFAFPLRYGVDDPAGMKFSATGYEKVYSDIGYCALRAGIGLLAKFRDAQKVIPRAHLRFGKTWFTGSSKDGFSGIDIAYGAALRYLIDDKWSFELEYSYASVYLDRVEINNYSQNTESGYDETVNSVILRCYYTVRFFVFE